jgi:hypothetical protein
MTDQVIFGVGNSKVPWTAMVVRLRGFCVDIKSNYDNIPQPVQPVPEA